MHGFHRPTLVLDHQVMADTGPNAIFTFEIIDDLNPCLQGTVHISFEVDVNNSALNLQQFSICQQQLQNALFPRHGRTPIPTTRLERGCSAWAHLETTTINGGQSCRSAVISLQ
ncbi:MAG: hypothetical protein JWM68_3515 [Verrucomicrobiales bacterium]|nr:hypothetical protein [Verrucomicrobiales bacterium]